MKKFLLFLFVFLIVFAGSVYAETLPTFITDDIAKIDTNINELILVFDQPYNRYNLLIIDKTVYGDVYFWVDSNKLVFSAPLEYRLHHYYLSNNSIATGYNIAKEPLGTYPFTNIVLSTVDIYSDSSKSNVFFSVPHPVAVQAEQLLPVIREQVGGIVSQAFKILSIVLGVTLVGYFLRSFLP